ncbi:MAG TPA: trigger factor [Acidimicrobiales bacterium]|nr:trigger factor [Acidimicrobiales bacterium]
MKTSVTELEDNKVKLSVEVDEQEFEAALDAAFRKIAREVRIPGFRPGKAPRRLLEARLGEGVARGEALRDAIPDYYAKAVREHDVDVIAAPEIDITEGEEAGPVAFDAVVEVRPVVTVPGYDSLRVTIPRPAATDEEIDAQIDRLRRQYSELATVERPAAEGDVVTIDVSGSQGGEVLSGLTAEDYSYEVGSGMIVPELDEALLGADAGTALSFDAAHPDDDEDEPLHFEVAVKEVRERVLPDATDEWAAEASEFDTLAELRDDLARRMTTVRKMQAQMTLRDKVGEAAAELVDVEVPEALVSHEMQQRLQDFAMRLQAQGLTLDTWLDSTGQDADQFVGELRETAVRAAKFDLALRAVAEAEQIEATDDELDAEFAQVASQLHLTPDEVRRRFDDSDQVSAVRADIRRRKALDWLVERVEIVDEDGEPIDRADLEPAEATEEAEDELAQAAHDASGVDQAGEDATVESPDHEEDTE